jgi:MtN3 and saliva related transmembrane protein
MNKDLILEILMCIAITCGYIGYIPQIIRIVKTKCTKDISLYTWIIWILAFLCGTVYSIILGRWELITAYISELFFSVVILSLTILYRKKP